MKLLQFIRKAFNWLTSPERFSLINGPLFKKENLSNEEIKEILAHPTNPVECCADANPKTMLPNDT